MCDLNIKAFSLVELLITLSVIALLITISPPAAKELWAERKLHSTSQTILNTLETAQQVALATKQPVDIIFDIKTNSLSTTWKTPLRTLTPTTPLLPKIYELPKGIKLELASFGNVEKTKETLTFYENGVVTPGSVIIRSDNNQRCSIIQALRGARRLLCS